MCWLTASRSFCFGGQANPSHWHMVQETLCDGLGVKSYWNSIYIACQLGQAQDRQPTIQPLGRGWFPDQRHISRATRGRDPLAAQSSFLRQWAGWNKACLAGIFSDSGTDSFPNLVNPAATAEGLSGPSNQGTDIFFFFFFKGLPLQVFKDPAGLESKLLAGRFNF